MSEPEIRPVSGDEPEFGQVIELMDLMREATAHFITTHSQPDQAMSLVMTAASMFSGSMFGNLLVLGAVTQQDTRRTVDCMSRNFRSGIDGGQRRATRIAANSIGGHA